MTEDPEWALEIASEFLPDFDEAVLEELVQEYSGRDLWPADGLLTPDRALETLRFFDEAGEIELDDISADSLDKYFEFSYLENALEQLDESDS
jgi:hypothetical protein